VTTAPQRENPYPGLRPFTEAEAHVFFGRDTLVDEMLLRLDRSRFLGVVGVSGSGKSSLLQAGLVPRLQGDLSSDASGRWRVLTMRPWTDPLGRLARGLARPGLLSMPGADASTPDVIEATLRRSGIGLLKLVAQALPSDARLLIIVDQFEELFRFKGSTLDGRFGDDPAALVALLLETVRGEAPVSVLISMRSDFIGECARFPGLAELMSASQYLVPRMTRDQLAEAITGPAAIEGVTLQPQLVQQLLNDVEDSQDQLPVLQHALMRTWQHWSQSATGAASGGAARAIDFDAYNATGGMARALSAHADQVLADLKDPTEQQAAQRIFRALTDQPPHAHPVRRPLRFGQLVEEVGADSAVVAAVVRHFSGGDRHFLVASDEVLKPGSIVDIAHESLLRLWDTLRGWLEEEQESRRRYAELVSAAERHT
jgi:energy-coupling factor transporter ATP-binding protein EcfA2